jgi:outer membrane lipoprotein-sorting protein
MPKNVTILLSLAIKLRLLSRRWKRVQDSLPGTICRKPWALAWGASLVLFLFCFGCQTLDPIARKVNAPKEFRATYKLSEVSRQMEGPAKVQTIHLILKKEKFLAAYYTKSQLTKKIIYDGRTFWHYRPKSYKNDKDIVIYKKASFGSLGGVYFWRMPPRRLPEPEERKVGDRTYYVYEYSDAGPSGHVEVSILVDAEHYIITLMTSNFFLKSAPGKPLIEWKFNCEKVAFGDDIPDSTFEFTPPEGAEVKSFRQAAKEGMEAFKELFSEAM